MHFIVIGVLGGEVVLILRVACDHVYWLARRTLSCTTIIL